MHVGLITLVSKFGDSTTRGRIASTVRLSSILCAAQTFSRLDRESVQLIIALVGF